MTRRPLAAWRHLALLLVLTPALACASAGGVGANPEVVTREEIEQVSASNALQVLERLRPRWIESRGRLSINTPTQIAVYQDDMRLGGLEMLDRIPVDMIISIRRLSAAQAGTLPGIGSMHVEHAIVVQTRRDPGGT